MKKRATTEWTMAKLMTLILAVFLLVLIIYGISNKGFGPLRENIEGRFNEVLILLNIRDDPGEVTCGESFSQKIDDVGDGMFYPCDDKCGFVLDGDDKLLGFSNFSIGKNGPLVVSKDGKIQDNDKAYVFGSAEAERHKVAYDLLNDTVEEFLASEYSGGMSYEEFVEAMSFDKGGVMFWEIDDSLDNTAYGHIDGVWRSGQVEDEKFVAKVGLFSSEDSNIMTNEVVLSKVLKMYNVFKRYNNDRDVYLRYSNFIGDNEEGFRNWFIYAKEEFSDSEDDELSIIFDRKGNKDVSYLWDGGSWEGSEYKRGALDKRMIVSSKSLGFFNDEELAMVIYEKYSNGENFNFRKSLYSGELWSVSEGEVRYTYNPTNDKTDEEFRKLFFDSLEEWGSKKKSQEDLLDKLGDYFGKDVFVKFGGQMLLVKFSEMSFEDGHSFPLVSFDTPDGGKFGVYYESGSPVLIDFSKERSKINKFLSFSDKDWEDFIKINKIYEHFKLRRCGQI